MDIDLDEVRKMTRGTARRLSREAVEPQAAEMDKTATFRMEPVRQMRG